MISKRGKSNTPTGMASHADVLLARYTILHPPRKSAETVVQWRGGGAQGKFG